MDAETVAQLDTPLGRRALVAAAGHKDSTTLSAATAMRALFPPELAAAALTQVELRRRAATKFGSAAETMFFTRDGLEQATRPEVAGHHAARFRAAGVSRVLDLGCGIGSDALAFLAAGLEVTAVEIEPATAAVARLNCGSRAEVIQGDAESLAARWGGPGVGVFCDPARRTTSGRVWRVEDFAPAWPFVHQLLTGGGSVGVKLGPALPHSFIPPGVEAEWVSHQGDTVEVGLWTGPGCQPGTRAALVLPQHRLVVPSQPPALAVAEPGRFIYEPDGAVIRAGAVTAVGEMVRGHLLDVKIAYLTSDLLVRTPFAAVFEILEVLPYQEKGLRRWLRAHRVGTVEIKKRGVEVDPAQLRKRLNLIGTEQATLILTRTPRGALALVVRRVTQLSG